MPSLIFGILVLVLVWWGMNAFAKADPKLLSRVLRPAGGIGTLAVAVLVGLRGHFEFALPLGIAGLSMLGWLPFGPAGLSRRTHKRSGATSRVRTAAVEMELDHDSGAMRGRFIDGRHAGETFDALDVATLVARAGEIDAESRALLAAYLDRRAAGWRENVEGGAAAGQGGAWTSGKMTHEEAYQILGLEPGASLQDIARAHRALMKKLHPDQGGSTYLAARVNQAKDVLLGRHG
ncbi:MAG: DnaJ domain-containing protein [Proteobacteria bacterium]|nr:DnaJ domain-containing protein [Pseudomonadota bacterium]